MDQQTSPNKSSSSPEESGDVPVLVETNPSSSGRESPEPPGTPSSSATRHVEDSGEVSSLTKEESVQPETSQVSMTSALPETKATIFGGASSQVPDPTQFLIPPIAASSESNSPVSKEDYSVPSKKLPDEALQQAKSTINSQSTSRHVEDSSEVSLLTKEESVQPETSQVSMTSALPETKATILGGASSQVPDPTQFLIPSIAASSESNSPVSKEDDSVSSKKLPDEALQQAKSTIDSQSTSRHVEDSSEGSSLTKEEFVQPETSQVSMTSALPETKATILGGASSQVPDPTQFLIPSIAASSESNSPVSKEDDSVSSKKLPDEALQQAKSIIDSQSTSRHVEDSSEGSSLTKEEFVQPETSQVSMTSALPETKATILGGASSQVPDPTQFLIPSIAASSESNSPVSKENDSVSSKKLPDEALQQAKSTIDSQSTSRHVEDSSEGSSLTKEESVQPETSQVSMTSALPETKATILGGASSQVPDPTQFLIPSIAASSESNSPVSKEDDSVSSKKLPDKALQQAKSTIDFPSTSSRCDPGSTDDEGLGKNPSPTKSESSQPGTSNVSTIPPKSETYKDSASSAPDSSQFSASPERASSERNSPVNINDELQPEAVCTASTSENTSDTDEDSSSPLPDPSKFSLSPGHTSSRRTSPVLLSDEDLKSGNDTLQTSKSTSVSYSDGSGVSTKEQYVRPFTPSVSSSSSTNEPGPSTSRIADEEPTESTPGTSAESGSVAPVDSSEPGPSGLSHSSRRPPFKENPESAHRIVDPDRSSSTLSSDSGAEIVEEANKSSDSIPTLETDSSHEATKVKKVNGYHLEERSSSVSQASDQQAPGPGDTPPNTKNSSSSSQSDQQAPGPGDTPPNTRNSSSSNTSCSSSDPPSDTSKESRNSNLEPTTSTVQSSEIPFLQNEASSIPGESSFATENKPSSSITGSASANVNLPSTSTAGATSSTSPSLQKRSEIDTFKKAYGIYFGKNKPESAPSSNPLADTPSSSSARIPVRLKKGSKTSGTTSKTTEQKIPVRSSSAMSILSSDISTPTSAPGSSDNISSEENVSKIPQNTDVSDREGDTSKNKDNQPSSNPDQEETLEQTASGRYSAPTLPGHSESLPSKKSKAWKSESDLKEGLPQQSSIRSYPTTPYLPGTRDKSDESENENTESTSISVETDRSEVEEDPHSSPNVMQQSDATISQNLTTTNVAATSGTQSSERAIQNDPQSSTESISSRVEKIIRSSEDSSERREVESFDQTTSAMFPSSTDINLPLLAEDSKSKLQTLKQQIPIMVDSRSSSTCSHVTEIDEDSESLENQSAASSCPPDPTFSANVTESSRIPLLEEGVSSESTAATTSLITQDRIKSSQSSSERKEEESFGSTGSAALLLSAESASSYLPDPSLVADNTGPSRTEDSSAPQSSTPTTLPKAKNNKLSDSSSKEKKEESFASTTAGSDLLLEETSGSAISSKSTNNSKLLEQQTSSTDVDSASTSICSSMPELDKDAPPSAKVEEEQSPKNQSASSCPIDTTFSADATESSKEPLLEKEVSCESTPATTSPVTNVEIESSHSSSEKREEESFGSTESGALLLSAESASSYTPDLSVAADNTGLSRPLLSTANSNVPQSSTATTSPKAKNNNSSDNSSEEKKVESFASTTAGSDLLLLEETSVSAVSSESIKNSKQQTFSTEVDSASTSVGSSMPELDIDPQPSAKVEEKQSPENQSASSCPPDSTFSANITESSKIPLLKKKVSSESTAVTTSPVTHEKIKSSPGSSERREKKSRGSTGFAAVRLSPGSNIPIFRKSLVSSVTSELTIRKELLKQPTPAKIVDSRSSSISSSIPELDEDPQPSAKVKEEGSLESQSEACNFQTDNISSDPSETSRPLLLEEEFSSEAQSITTTTSPKTDNNKSSDSSPEEKKEETSGSDLLVSQGTSVSVVSSESTSNKELLEQQTSTTGVHSASSSTYRNVSIFDKDPQPSSKVKGEKVKKAFSKHSTTSSFPLRSSLFDDIINPSIGNIPADDTFDEPESNIGDTSTEIKKDTGSSERTREEVFLSEISNEEEAIVKSDEASGVEELKDDGRDSLNKPQSSPGLESSEHDTSESISHKEMYSEQQTADTTVDSRSSSECSNIPDSDQDTQYVQKVVTKESLENVQDSGSSSSDSSVPHCLDYHHLGSTADRAASMTENSSESSESGSDNSPLSTSPIDMPKVPSVGSSNSQENLADVEDQELGIEVILPPELEQACASCSTNGKELSEEVTKNEDKAFLEIEGVTDVGPPDSESQVTEDEDSYGSTPTLESLSPKKEKKAGSSDTFSEETLSNTEFISQDDESTVTESPPESSEDPDETEILLKKLMLHQIDLTCKPVNPKSSIITIEAVAKFFKSKLFRDICARDLDVINRFANVSEQQAIEEEDTPPMSEAPPPYEEADTVSQSSNFPEEISVTASSTSTFKIVDNKKKDLSTSVDESKPTIHSQIIQISDLDTPCLENSSTSEEEYSTNGSSHSHLHKSSPISSHKEEDETSSKTSNGSQEFSVQSSMASHGTEGKKLTSETSTNKRTKSPEFELTDKITPKKIKTIEPQESSSDPGTNIEVDPSTNEEAATEESQISPNSRKRLLRKRRRSKVSLTVHKPVTSSHFRKKSKKLALPHAPKRSSSGKCSGSPSKIFKRDPDDDHNDDPPKPTRSGDVKDAESSSNTFSRNDNDDSSKQVIGGGGSETSLNIFKTDDNSQGQITSSGDEERSNQSIDTLTPEGSPNSENEQAQFTVESYAKDIIKSMTSIPETEIDLMLHMTAIKIGNIPKITHQGIMAYLSHLVSSMLHMISPACTEPEIAEGERSILEIDYRMFSNLTDEQYKKIWDEMRTYASEIMKLVEDQKPYSIIHQIKKFEQPKKCRCIEEPQASSSRTLPICNDPNCINRPENDDNEQPPAHTSRQEINNPIFQDTPSTDQVEEPLFQIDQIENIVRLNVADIEGNLNIQEQDPSKYISASSESSEDSSPISQIQNSPIVEKQPKIIIDPLTRFEKEESPVFKLPSFPLRLKEIVNYEENFMESIGPSDEMQNHHEDSTNDSSPEEYLQLDDLEVSDSEINSSLTASTEKTEDTKQLQKWMKYYQKCVESSSPDTKWDEFVYHDTDTIEAEIEEWYTYSEEPEFASNLQAFQEQMHCFNYTSTWSVLQLEQQENVIMQLLNQLESSDRTIRMKAARAILYIAQGCWDSSSLAENQRNRARRNVFLLYRAGVFTAFVTLLHVEMASVKQANTRERNLGDSEEIRVILSVLYIITEVIRKEKESEDVEFKKEVQSFFAKLLEPENHKLLGITILDMLEKFRQDSVTYAHFPPKKILLMLWKWLLVTLEGSEIPDDTKPIKQQQRQLTVPINGTTFVNLTKKDSPEKKVAQVEGEKLEVSNDDASRGGPTELIYEAMLSKFSNYVEVMMTFFEQTSRDETSDIPYRAILSDVIPTRSPRLPVDYFQYIVDVFRHKEIVLKAISAIFLLLLRRFEANHRYQFECMSQNLALSNCIPAIMKFFKQGIVAYIKTENRVAGWEFPHCVIRDYPPVDIQTPNLLECTNYSWRNMFVATNLIQILHKITNEKQSRIRIMTDIDSLPILADATQIKNPNFQDCLKPIVKVLAKEVVSRSDGLPQLLQNEDERLLLEQIQDFHIAKYSQQEGAAAANLVTVPGAEDSLRPNFLSEVEYQAPHHDDVNSDEV